METENLNEMKARLIELTKTYGLKATPEQQKEVIELGKKIEALEKRNNTH